MKNKFTIHQWGVTENGFEEIEPKVFEFGLCKVNGNLYICVEGFKAQKLTLGTMFTETVNDMLLYSYKMVLNNELTEKVDYLKEEEIKYELGDFYFKLLNRVFLMDKKIKKRDRIKEIFGNEIRN